MTRAGGVSPLSLLTFFAAAKKVSAAPHRGNACSTDMNSRMPAKKAKSKKSKKAKKSRLRRRQTINPSQLRWADDPKPASRHRSHNSATVAANPR
ncbi:hypothetical protein FRZ40_02815 [Paraburkholderia azotifigens]|uniref:Uncharacterized protein n=1 Tax=Paraburkholderia azotifigens TaxID=2057004 RepID=A0A5C6VPU9_9BURK|nr:hypothetical protein FRZ40_02815 [Paraburkholderia azotifigens]